MGSADCIIVSFTACRFFRAYGPGKSDIIIAAIEPHSNDSKSREALVFHSDRGCQYSSQRNQKLLSENGIEGSMSKAGCPYDISYMESFFASLKMSVFYGGIMLQLMM